MTPVWLVIAMTDGFVVRECEGTDNGDGTWTVNTRGKGCRSKMLETIPSVYVHRTYELALQRKTELARQTGAR